MYVKRISVQHLKVNVLSSDESAIRKRTVTRKSFSENVPNDRKS